jgi:hypothetical protein
MCVVDSLSTINGRDGNRVFFTKFFNCLYWVFFSPSFFRNFLSGFKVLLKLRIDLNTCHVVFTTVLFSFLGDEVCRFYWEAFARQNVFYFKFMLQLNVCFGFFFFVQGLNFLFKLFFFSSFSFKLLFLKFIVELFSIHPFHLNVTRARKEGLKFLLNLIDIDTRSPGFRHFLSFY